VVPLCYGVECPTGTAHRGTRPTAISRKQRAISRTHSVSVCPTAVHSRVHLPSTDFSVVSNAYISHCPLCLCAGRPTYQPEGVAEWSCTQAPATASVTVTHYFLMETLSEPIALAGGLYGSVVAGLGYYPPHVAPWSVHLMLPGPDRRFNPASDRVHSEFVPQFLRALENAQAAIAELETETRPGQLHRDLTPWHGEFRAPTTLIMVKSDRGHAWCELTIWSDQMRPFTTDPLQRRDLQRIVAALEAAQIRGSEMAVALNLWPASGAVPGSPQRPAGCLLLATVASLWLVTALAL
jgi:hypothetical protein